jgi:branched-chain amino acid transport system permease protein
MSSEIDPTVPWYKKLTGEDYRRIATGTAGGVVLAVMTGPEGTIADPLYALRVSLLTAHIIGYLIFGIAIGCLLTYRAKIRDGVWQRRRATPRIPMAEKMAATSGPARSIALGGSGVVAVVAALLIADFSGPYVSHKASLHVIAHQFLYTRTYGYLALALAIWFTGANQVFHVTNVRLRSLPKWSILVGALVGSLLFGLTADPFLRPRFSWRAIEPTYRNSMFHHWPTYLWVVLALLLTLSYLRKRNSAAPMSATSRRRGLVVTPSMRVLTYLGAGFIALEAPKYLSSYWQISLYQQIGIFCLLAVGLNVVVGFAGLLDLGYVAFYALGAYTTAYFSGALPLQPPFHLNPFVVIPAAVVVAMLAGVLLGLPTLRLRGDYLAIVTLGFGEIVYVLANDWTSVTGGSPGTLSLPTFSVSLLGLHYSWNPADPLSYYYLMLGVIVPVIVLFDFLNNSKVGRSWAAIREDEVAAQSLGINALKYKVMAFAIGASTAGVAGVFTAAKVGVLFPATFVLQLSITILVLVIFGGMGSILGVLVGAVFLQWLPSYLTFHSYLGYQESDLYLYIGALLVIMMIFRPQGLVPSKRRRREFADAELGLGSADALGAITQEQPS